MTVRLHKLAVTGLDKESAIVDFGGETHLVFGPTDTGKSYIIECLRYSLGSSRRPKDIGYSEGYTRILLQLTDANEKKYTIFRDLVEGNELIYEGFWLSPPTEMAPLDLQLNQLFISLANGADKRILIKTGTLGNLTAGDLRRVSIFDEIETLDNTAIEGGDTNLKLRNKSALALILTGTDDSQVLLPPSTTEKNITKGRIEAFTEEISKIRASIPKEKSKEQIKEELAELSREIEHVTFYLQNHTAELSEAKKEWAKINRQNQKISQNISALSEAMNRFLLLDKKYESDLQRLQAISTASTVIHNFEIRPCPLCLTDIKESKKDLNMRALEIAAHVEAEKILSLREGLKTAIKDVSEEISELRQQLNRGTEASQLNVGYQEELLAPVVPSMKIGLKTLMEQRSTLSMFLRDLHRADELDSLLVELAAKTKQPKKAIKRDLSKSATSLCDIVTALLKEWGVPEVGSVHFDEAVADIQINHRKRTSYGKGKRGIFLTAYVVALMENAISNGFPHLGFVAVDSPVVTYKDPKYINDDSAELLPLAVKDNFYAWLANRNEKGQIIVLENEEPIEDLKRTLHITEFFGSGTGKLTGRIGFFPH